LAVRLVIIVTLSLLGGACAEIPAEIPKATAMEDGVAVPPPAGWTDYCHRHLEDPGCRS
jgi:predicted transglutaminase-like cysteine proteinase